MSPQGPLALLNGRFVEPSEAKVSAFDAGFQHGVGLFETMLASMSSGEPRVFRIESHLARLGESAKTLGLTEALRLPALAEAVELAVARSGLVTETNNARIRLTLTGGDLNMLREQATKGGGAGDPTVLIQVTPAQRYPDEMFDKGILLSIADTRANPLNPHESHKTLNYWWRLRALQQAAARGAGEALVLQVTNHICGGAVSNLFTVKDGVLRTPPSRGEEEPGAIPSPVLPGITRSVILETAQSKRIPHERKHLSINDLLDADEAFLTNASWGVLPVTKVEQSAIGDGMPGEVTKTLRADWLKRVREEA